MSDRSKSRNRKRLWLILIILVLGVLLPVSAYGFSKIYLPVISAPVAERPNVLVIEVDDLDEATFDQLLNANLLPNIQEYIIDEGVRFTNSFVTNSACCPSRASFLTGQYVHNHGVNSIGGDSGGFHGFHPDNDMERATIASWLQDTGDYYTGIIGKYMNHYRPDASGIYPIPTGWDFWRVTNATGTHQLEPGKYELVSGNGRAQKPAYYQTRQIGLLAKDSLTGLASEGSEFNNPWGDSGKGNFFLYLTPTAPHVVSLPEDYNHYADCDRPHPQWLERVVPDSAVTNGYHPEDYNFPDAANCHQEYPAGCLRQDGIDGNKPVIGFDIPGIEKLGSAEKFLETYDQGEGQTPDESLRPAWVDFHWDPLSCSNNLENMQRQHLDRLESMLSVDVMVGEVIAAIEEDVLDKTLIIFTSDNGFMLGEHRLGNKQVAYEEATRVPLAIRPPGKQNNVGININQLVANIDLAPTILDYAGLIWRDYEVDGRSLKPLVEQNESEVNWRQSLLIEHWHPDGFEDRLTDSNQWWRVPTHFAIRTGNTVPGMGDLIYVNYDDPEWGRANEDWRAFFGSDGYSAEFLYDLNQDPYQRKNFIQDEGFKDTLDYFRQTLTNLKGCQNETCRVFDR